MADLVAGSVIVMEHDTLTVSGCCITSWLHKETTAGAMGDDWEEDANVSATHWPQLMFAGQKSLVEPAYLWHNGTDTDNSAK